MNGRHEDASGESRRPPLASLRQDSGQHDTSFDSIALIDTLENRFRIKLRTRRKHWWTNPRACRGAALITPTNPSASSSYCGEEELLLRFPFCRTRFPTGRRFRSDRRCVVPLSDEFPFGAEALIRPSPKLPTSRSPPNLPKCLGAIASPRASSVPPAPIRRTRCRRVEFVHPRLTPRRPSRRLIRLWSLRS